MSFSPKIAAGELLSALRTASAANDGGALGQHTAAMLERYLAAAFEAGRSSARSSPTTAAATSRKRPPLTTRQEQALDFVCSYFAEHRRSPTLAEIGAAMGIRTLNSVADHVSALAAKGYVTKTAHTARSILPVDLPPPEIAEAMRAGEGSSWPLRDVLERLVAVAGERCDDCEPPLHEAVEPTVRGAIAAARCYLAGRPAE